MQWFLSFFVTRIAPRLSSAHSFVMLSVLKVKFGLKYEENLLDINGVEASLHGAKCFDSAHHQSPQPCFTLSEHLKSLSMGTKLCEATRKEKNMLKAGFLENHLFRDSPSLNITKKSTVSYG
jgi:hypothetical protein